MAGAEALRSPGLPDTDLRRQHIHALRHVGSLSPIRSGQVRESPQDVAVRERLRSRGRGGRGRGGGTDVDFVSRFFAPGAGIPEDPVTGSAHCTLIPYWAEKLGKTRMIARQLSRRGGTIHCELRGDRVGIGGEAVLYSRAELQVPG